MNELFGLEVGSVVDYLTDLPGANRKIRKEKWLARMAGVISADDPKFPAMMVKLADRTANMRTGLAEGNKGMLKVYLKEMPSFLYLYRGIRHHPLARIMLAKLADVRAEAEELVR